MLQKLAVLLIAAATGHCTLRLVTHLGHQAPGHLLLEERHLEWNPPTALAPTRSRSRSPTPQAGKPPSRSGSPSPSHLSSPPRPSAAARRGSLASVTEHDGTLYVLCFSDEGPDTGPHPISQEELRAAFNPSNGWNLAAVEPDRVQTRYHDDGAPAWWPRPAGWWGLTR